MSDKSMQLLLQSQILRNMLKESLEGIGKKMLSDIAMELLRQPDDETRLQYMNNYIQNMFPNIVDYAKNFEAAAQKVFEDPEVKAIFDELMNVQNQLSDEKIDSLVEKIEHLEDGKKGDGNVH